MTTNGTPAEQPQDQSVRGIGENLFDRDVNERSNTRLALRAIANGWPISQEVRQLVVDKMSSIVKSGRDHRNRIAASRVLVSADNVNSRREATEAAAEKDPAQVNVYNNTQVNIGIQEDESWYGDSKAHALSAKATPPPGSGVAGPEPVQGACVRPALGEDGHGSANGHAGPRTE